MIFMYPLLVSNTVSSNIIPGMCKSLEKFALAYRMNELSAMTEGFTVVNGEDLLSEQKIRGGSNPASSAKAAAGLSKQLSGIRDQQKGLTPNSDEKRPERASATFELATMNSDIVSVEPTFITIEVEKNGAKIQRMIGVKVVPYSVTSDAGLAQLLTSDSAVSSLSSHLIAKGRAVQRMFWKAWNAAIRPIPIIGDPSSATGDPRHDILMARSKYGRHILVCMNYMDLQSEFFRSEGPKKIDKLHRMGWDSLIFPDDVQKRVYYCMKEFKGVCSVVPYSMVYSSVGKLSAAAYENLEDVRKTTSPFFRNKKVSTSQLMKEGVDIDNVIEGYLGMVQEKLPVNESLDKYASAISSMVGTSGQLNRMKEVLVNKNYKQFKSMKSMLPKTTIEDTKKFASKNLKDFDRLYIKAKRVYSNSVGMKLNNNETAIELMSIMTAARASTSEKPDMAFTEIVKKSTYEVEDNIDPTVTPLSTDRDLVIGALVFSVIAVAAVSGFVGAILTFGLADSGWIMASITMACLGILYYRLGSQS